MDRFEQMLARVYKRIRMTADDVENMNNDFDTGMPRSYITQIYGLSPMDYKVLKEQHKRVGHI